MLFQCYTCPKNPKFSTANALKAHNSASKNHSPWPYCYPCSQKFISEIALDDHLSNYHRPSRYNRCTIDYDGRVQLLTPQTTQFRCCDCDKDFSSEVALDQHLRDKVHTKEPAALVGFFCGPCNRTFHNDHALEQHLNSVKHKPLIEELKCITGSECGKKFTSPSAMLHHLESGGCTFGINRQRIDRLIKEKDTDGIITSQAGLEGRIHSEYGDSSDSENDYGSVVSSSSSGVSDVQINTPTSSMQGDSIALMLSSAGVVFTPDSDDNFSLDPEAPDVGEGPWTCPICPPRIIRTYNTTNSLLQHMNSAAHAPLSYHCPIRLAVGREGSIRPFTTLSGMTQHLESGACKGGKGTFKKSVIFVNQKLRELGFADMKLIS